LKIWPFISGNLFARNFSKQADGNKNLKYPNPNLIGHGVGKEIDDFNLRFALPGSHLRRYVDIPIYLSKRNGSQLGNRLIKTLSDLFLETDDSDNLSSQANPEPLHLFRSPSPLSISDPGVYELISPHNWRQYLLPSQAYNSSVVYDSIEADKWIENKYHRCHNMLTVIGNISRSDSRSVDFSSESPELEPSTLINMTKSANSIIGAIKGPVACMLAYDTPALCLFGETSSDMMVGMARELAELSAFPVIIRPLSEYPSELVESA
jgi:hypothetical protein